MKKMVEDYINTLWTILRMQDWKKQLAWGNVPNSGCNIFADYDKKETVINVNLDEFKKSTDIVLQNIAFQISFIYAEQMSHLVRKMLTNGEIKCSKEIEEMLMKELNIFSVRFGEIMKAVMSID